MLDFHTHILPGVDDGSRSVSMSMDMLRLEKEQGVDTVILTPHFYAEQNSPAHFLERRRKAWEMLFSNLEEDTPQILLGAEVQYFEGIAYAEGIENLCIENTNVLLLEMPFSHWDTRTVQTVLDLSDGGFQIVLAHIERYMSDQPSGVWKRFRDHGILMQGNTSLFKGFFERRKAMSMLRKGELHFLGTDCHNMSSRSPDWQKVPGEAIQIMDRNMEEYFGSAINSL